MIQYQNLIRNLLTDSRTQVKPTRSGVYAISDLEITPNMIYQKVFH